MSKITRFAAHWTFATMQSIMMTALLIKYRRPCHYDRMLIFYTLRLNAAWHDSIVYLDNFPTKAAPKLHNVQAPAIMVFLNRI